MLFLHGRNTAERADRQARRWVVRLDRGPLKPGELRRFERWLKDDLNVRAFGRAQALWSALDLPPQVEEQAAGGARWASRNLWRPWKRRRTGLHSNITSRRILSVADSTSRP